MKRLLSVPIRTPDPALYILSGFLPVEAHKKALIFFNNVCHQSERSIEKRLAIRQTTVKSMKSKSWFIDIKKLLWKYEIGDTEECLSLPLTKLKWKCKVNQTLHGSSDWTDVIVNRASLYNSLTYINFEKYQPGQIHPLLKTEPNSVRDIPRIAIKLKISCGVYTLQSTKASFNQNIVDPIYQVFCSAPETLVHFILECPVLSTIRNPIINDISNEYRKLNYSKVIFENLCKVDQLKIILDCSYLTNSMRITKNLEKLLLQLQALEFQTTSRRFVHNLHCARYRMLREIPVRRR